MVSESTAAYMKIRKATQEYKEKYYARLKEPHRKMQRIESWHQRPEAREKQHIRQRTRRATEESKKKARLHRQTEKYKLRTMKRIIENIDIRLSKRLSGMIRSSLKHNKSGRHWEDLVGYTVEQLKYHLENLFDENMSWQNYGDWHIDHIIPKSWWEYKSFEDGEFKQCWSLCNLQPLWASDNLKKNNKIGGV